MNVEAEVIKLEKQRLTLTRIGMGLTGLFSTIVAGYAYSKGDEVFTLSLNNMGDFLAGAFAPLAFLWLVIGYRMQALELEQNSRALQAQVLEMKNTVGASKQNVLNQAIDVYRYELSRICHDINLIFARAVYTMHCNDMWTRYMQGDVNVIINEFITHNKHNLLLGIPLPLRDDEEYNPDKNMCDYADAYVSLFDKFMAELSSLDESGVFVKVFSVSPFKEARDILDSNVAKPCEGQS